MTLRCRRLPRRRPCSGHAPAARAFVTCEVRQVRPIRGVASTVAFTLASTVASPERTTLPGANDQRRSPDRKRPCLLDLLLRRPPAPGSGCPARAGTGHRPRGDCRPRADTAAARSHLGTGCDDRAPLRLAELAGVPIPAESRSGLQRPRRTGAEQSTRAGLRPVTGRRPPDDGPARPRRPEARRQQRCR